MSTRTPPPASRYVAGDTDTGAAVAIHVLVVDDSAVVRQVVRAILTADPDLDVDVAADPLIAIRKMERRRPDVMLLDLELPRMDGLSFLRKIMRESPLPVVVCSSHAQRGTALALRALEEGAVEVIAKTRLGVREFLEESAILLTDAIRAASRARLRPSARVPPGPVAPATGPVQTAAGRTAAVRAGRGAPALLALGASTGGPDAIRQILRGLPADAPPVLIAQHMPAGFTGAFAARLDESCALEVREARDGDRLAPGRVLVAPGDRHMELDRDRAGYLVRVRGGPLVARHRPSIDLLFHSVARLAGRSSIGVLLTGMGTDGATGLAAMRSAGARTIAQDEASCVVFGMPAEAIRLGAAERVVSLDRISTVIRSWIGAA